MMILLRESPLPLQLSYGILVVGLKVRCGIIYYSIPEVRNKTFFLSILFYLIGTACWLLDLHYCAQFEFFYLHAWWHLFAGLGTYYIIQFICSYHLFVSRDEKHQLAKLLGHFHFTIPYDLQSKDVHSVYLIIPKSNV